MDYLKDFGFTVEEIKYLCDELDEEDVHELIIHENRVINILKYLKSIGLENIKDVVRCRTELFYINSSIVKKAFSNVDLEKTVKLINEDISNFDLVNL